MTVDVDDPAADTPFDLEVGRLRPDAREMCSDFVHPTSLCSMTLVRMSVTVEPDAYGAGNAAAATSS